MWSVLRRQATGNALANRRLALVGMQQQQQQWRALSSESKSIEEFVKDSMARCGLDQFAEDTISRLKDAQVINTDLLFRLTDSDFSSVGLSVGASRALKDAIAETKRAEIVAKSGERAQVRRALSMKEKRGF